ncbi:MAG: hypothetical protein JO002_12585 [Burkholderiaceae bacterium]|nr:hypothetical protein [Burkholderiaceae bacterium]
MKPTTFRQTAGIAALLLGPACAAYASVPADAEALVKKGDNAAAIALLEPAAAKGDNSAKATLALYLFGLPAPFTNVQRACKLAQESSDAGEALGMIVRADCLMSGNEQAAHPFDEARKLARKAQAAGLPGGGFELYKIFMADPQYRIISEGKPDQVKYRQLAELPIARRGEQIEALNGLAFAAVRGNTAAMMPMLGYLIETTAPKNAGRATYLADLMQKNGMAIPAPFTFVVQKAQWLTQLGDSNVSVKIFDQAYDKIAQSVAEQFSAGKAGSCNAKDVKLTAMAAEPITDAQYLPLTEFLTSSYLVHGSWNETWTFTGCGKTLSVKAAFKADGWGNAAFEFKVPLQR